MLLLVTPVVIKIRSFQTSVAREFVELQHVLDETHDESALPRKTQLTFIYNI